MLGLVNHIAVCIESHFSCKSYCAEYQICYRDGKMLVDCMLSQPYQSLIELQNRCLVYSNRNSVIQSNVNQFENPVGADTSTKRFSLSLTSVTNLSMVFLHFSSNDFIISVLSFFRLSSIISYCKLIWLMLKFSCDYAGIQKFNFRYFKKYWNDQSTIATWSVEKLVLFPYHCICGILLQLG